MVSSEGSRQEHNPHACQTSECLRLSGSQWRLTWVQVGVEGCSHHIVVQAPEHERVVRLEGEEGLVPPLVEVEAEVEQAPALAAQVGVQ